MEGNGELEAEIACTFWPMYSAFGPDGYVGSQEEGHGQASMDAPMSGFDSNQVDGYECFCSAQTAVYGYGGREAEQCLRRGLYMDDLQASMAALSSADKDLQSLLQKCSMGFVCSDEFCMFEFKVRRCMRGRSHDWTECPFAHPGEKARRRDPRRYRYSGTACPDYRKDGACRKGDTCELSHGVFECWLHPARYRTQPCKDGRACRRRICFFAHSPAQLRLGVPGDEQIRLPGPPLASSTDSKAGYFDALFEGPPLIKSQVTPEGAGHGIAGCIGANGFTDKIGPQSMMGFQTDGIGRFSSHGHGLLVHGHENNARGHSHQLQGISVDDLSAILELDSDQNRRHGYFNAADGYRPGNHLAHELKKCHCYFNNSGSHPCNHRHYLGLTGFKSGLDQLMSPTSTLAGPHFFSPLPLSLPLSPAESPPVSPSTGFSTWNNVLPSKMASISSVQPRSCDAFAQNPPKEANRMHLSTIDNRMHPSTIDNLMHSSTIHCLPNADDHGSSVYLPPVSTICDGDQLDGEHALQRAINIENQNAEMLPVSNQPVQAMTDLISMLNGLNIAPMDIKNRKRWASLLQSISLTKTYAHRPSSFLAHDYGQGSRCKKDGKVTMEEMDNPDLGWVNELVK